MSQWLILSSFACKVGSNILRNTYLGSSITKYPWSLILSFSTPILSAPEIASSTTCTLLYQIWILDAFLDIFGRVCKTPWNTCRFYPFFPSRIGCWSCTPRYSWDPLGIYQGHGLGPTKRKSCWNVRCSGIWRHAVKAWTEFAWFSLSQNAGVWRVWWLTKPTSFTFCQKWPWSNLTP